jgi:hypothetical protein
MVFRALPSVVLLWRASRPATALRMHGRVLNIGDDQLKAQLLQMVACGCGACGDSPPMRSTRAKRPAAGPPEGILTFRMPSIPLLPPLKFPWNVRCLASKPQVSSLDRH